MAVFSLLSRSALAAESKWLPSATGLDSSSSACANDYKFGTTRIVQCAKGTPTTTQIAYNTYGKTDKMVAAPAPKSWVSIQDHGVSLVPINASEPTKGWFKSQSGFSTTNWGGNIGDFIAQGHMTWYGDKDGDGMQGTNAVRSGMSYGYISYTAKDKCDDNVKTQAASKSDAELRAFGPRGLTQAEVDLIRKHCNGTYDQTLGENQFLVSAGGGISYYLNGCPNYGPGNTSANMNYTCPRVPIKPGGYKFSILGMLFGSMINSARASSFGNYTASTSPHYRDLALYKSLVLTTTLDVTNVGKSASAKSAWVEFRNGTTVNFTDLSNTTDIAGTRLHFVSPGSGEDEIIMKFSEYYSTGKYTRDTAAVKAEFGAIPCDMSNGMDVCVRDNTGFGDSPESFPMGGNIGVKKMGKGGMAALPNIDCGNGAGYPASAYTTACDVTSYAGATQSPASTAEELAVAGGAPKLEVSEVRPVKVYMRRHSGCSGRPDKPAATDTSGTLGTTWVNAPSDCPAWYLASNNAGSDWMSATTPAKWLIDCEAGDLKCYLIDVHFDLTYSDGTRTVLGNPENDAGATNYGWAKGSFFMYDPEIGTGKSVSGFGADDISVSDKPAPPTSSPSPTNPTNPPPAAVSPATTVAASASTLVLAALSALLL